MPSKSFLTPRKTAGHPSPDCTLNRETRLNSVPDSENLSKRGVLDRTPHDTNLQIPDDAVLRVDSVYQTWEGYRVPYVVEFADPGDNSFEAESET
jgi:hypothetical protein